MLGLVSGKATALQGEAVRIGSYSGVRVEAFGPRDGQLSEKAREAAAIVRKIEAMMAPEFREVTAYIADILIDHSTGKLITCQEFASSRLQASLGRVVKDKTPSSGGLGPTSTSPVRGYGNSRSRTEP